MSEMGKRSTTKSRSMLAGVLATPTPESFQKSLTSSGASVNQAFTARKIKDYHEHAGKYLLKVKQAEYVDVKKLPLDMLANLWGARFGDKWVKLEELNKDDLYCAVAQRLMNEGHLERQTRTNATTTVFRLRERE